MKMKSLLALIFAALAFTASGFAAQRPALLATGTPAPDFTAYRADGTAVKLSEFRGKPVLIDFWATWCGPCKHAMPHMEEVHQEYGPKGLVVLGVCVWDKKADFDTWQTNPQVPTTYLKVFDPAGRAPTNIARALYNVSGIPTFYLVGADGKIVFSGIGSDDDTARSLDRALKRLKL